MAHDVFISYSSKDQVIADAVCKILEERKIKCWIDHRDDKKGTIFTATLKKAIEDSKALVYIHSKDSNESDFVMKEVLWADKNHKDIIPFCIENVPIREELAMILAFVTRQLAYSGKCINNIKELANSVEEIIKPSIEDFDPDHRKICFHGKISESNCLENKPVKYCPNCGCPYPENDKCRKQQCRDFIDLKTDDEDLYQTQKIKEKECPECKTPNPIYANFCNYCGHKFKIKGEILVPQKEEILNDEDSDHKNSIPSEEGYFEENQDPEPKIDFFGFLKNLKDKKFFKPITIVLVGCIVLCIYLALTKPPVTSVNISSPGDLQQVPRISTFQGTFNNVPESQEIWLYVYPSEAMRYYPEPKPVTKIEQGTSGKWIYYNLVLGSEEASEVGKIFKIGIFLANVTDRQKITDQINKVNGSSKGMDKLPDNIIDLGFKISVYRT